MYRVTHTDPRGHNVRSTQDYSSNANIIGQLVFGDEFQLIRTEQASTGTWHQITWQGRTGWIFQTDSLTFVEITDPQKWFDMPTREWIASLPELDNTIALAEAFLPAFLGWMKQVRDEQQETDHD